jgi:hypothetical protein
MFAAYKIAEDNPTNVEPTGEFLQNSSYNSIPVSSSTICQISSDSESVSKQSDQSDGEEEEVRRRSPSPKKVEYFYVDRDRKKEYLKLNELPHRAVPLYKISRNFKRSSKKRVFRRYFNVKRIKKLASVNPVPLMDETIEKDETMRIHLIKNPSEIDKWIEYINYKVKVLN